MAQIHGSAQRDIEGGRNVQPVTYTDEHAASSYGVLVALVGMGSEAHGPADFPAGTRFHVHSDTSDADAQRVADAGFVPLYRMDYARHTFGSPVQIA